LLRPAVVKRALAYAEAAIAVDRSADQRAALEDDLAFVDGAIKRLTAAIATGGGLAPLVAALKTYDDSRRDLAARIAAILRATPDRLFSAARITAACMSIRQFAMKSCPSRPAVGHRCCMCRR